MYVEFGNANAVEAVSRSDAKVQGEHEVVPLTGKRVTRLDFPEGTTLAEAFTTSVAVVGQHFAALEDGDGTHAPKWVESDSDGLAALLGEHFGVPTSAPKNWSK